MANPHPYVRWAIDADNLTLYPTDDSGEPVKPKRGSYSGQEWARMVWPPCPVCGTRVEVQQIEVSTLYDANGPWLNRQYMMGYWECPNSCDVRPALWGEDWNTRKS